MAQHCTMNPSSKGPNGTFSFTKAAVLDQNCTSCRLKDCWTANLQLSYHVFVQLALHFDASLGEHAFQRVGTTVILKGKQQL